MNYKLLPAKSSHARAWQLALRSVTKRPGQRRTTVRGNASVAWLALLLSLASGGFLAWQQLLGPLASEVAGPAKAISNTASVQVAKTPPPSVLEIAEPDLDQPEPTDTRGLSSRLARLEDRMPAAIAALETEQNRTSQARAERDQLNALYQRSLRDTTSQALFDVEALLVQASRQLVGSTDFQASISLLNAARERLGRLETPALEGLINAVEQDRETLLAMGERSLVQAADALQRLASSLDDLPLQSARQGVPAQTGVSAPSTSVAPTTSDVDSLVEGDKTWWQNLVQSSSKLVTLPDTAQTGDLIRMTEVGQSDLALMPTSAGYFVVQNLRLRLLSARLLLLIHDRGGFEADRLRSQTWLIEHFEASDPQVVAAIALLQELSSLGQPPAIASLAHSTKALSLARSAVVSESTEVKQ